MEGPEKQIKEKLRQFIRKYYTNKILRGVIILLGVSGLLFLFFSLIEWNLYTSGIIRMWFVLLTAAAFLWIFVSGILFPLLKLVNIRKGISDENAAIIIGKHFQQVDDRLLNLIELSRLKEASTNDLSLLDESIRQKSDELKPFSFKQAVSYSSNKKPFIRTALVLMTFVVLLIVFPSGFKGSVNRVVNFQKEFERPQPFSFVLLNDSLSTEINSSYTIEMRVQGEVIPDEVYLNFGEDEFLMIREGNRFRYTLPSVNQNTSFRFYSGKISSRIDTLRVFPVPVILEFETITSPPLYTGIVNDTIQNNGDLIIPEGTQVNWKFYTRDVKSVFIQMKETSKSVSAEKTNAVEFSKKFFSSEAYKVFTKNQYLSSKDTLKYFVEVIKDGYPEISVEPVKDSNSFFRMFFTGEIRDDYGISDLRFYCRGGDSLIFSSEVNHGPENRQRFFYSYDFKEYFNKYKQVEYYFMVEDNDKVNGQKKAFSRTLLLDFPDNDEIEREIKKQNESISGHIEKDLLEMEDFSKEVERLKEKLINQVNEEWEGRKSLEEMMKDFERMIEQQKRMKEELEQNRLYEEQFNKTDQRLLDKQKQLEHLMEEVVDEEMKKMLEELKKLMEEMNEENMNKALDKLEMSSEEMEKHLDRSLELFKQLKFEKSLDQVIKDAEKLQEKQEKLRQDAEDSRRKDLETLAEEEKEVQDEIDSLSKKFDNLEKLNKQLEKPNNFQAPDKEAESAKDKAGEAAEELQKKHKNDAIQKMKETQEKLKSISLSLNAQMQQMMQQNMAEDIDNLKQILENLITLSFDQEQLMNDFSQVRRNDPQYVEMIQDQFTLQEKLEVVQDSLIALSRRQVMIKGFIDDELTKIKDNMERSIEFFNDRNLRSGLSRQQYSMMHINNLALMLSEAMKNMQSSLNSMGSGKGQPKPGQGGKPKMSEIRKMQQQLQKQLQQMKEGQKGKKPGQGQQGMSEQMARMAAKQAQIRRKLEEYRQELMKQGNGDKGLSQSIKKMEENETDLVNKRITQEMIERQKEIITRLLKSEKAKREQEKEERREGQSAEDFDRSNPDIFKFKEMIEKGRDILKEVPPKMNPYYKKKVNEYFIEESK